MGTVHDLLEAKGKQGAIEAGIARSVVEAAAQYLSEEDNALSFVYSGWAQCALPHKRLVQCVVHFAVVEHSDVPDHLPTTMKDACAAEAASIHGSAVMRFHF